MRVDSVWLLGVSRSVVVTWARTFPVAVWQNHVTRPPLNDFPEICLSRHHRLSTFGQSRDQGSTTPRPRSDDSPAGGLDISRRHLPALSYTLKDRPLFTLYLRTSLFSYLPQRRHHALPSQQVCPAPGPSTVPRTVTITAPEVTVDISSVGAEQWSPQHGILECGHRRAEAWRANYCFCRRWKH